MPHPQPANGHKPNGNHGLTRLNLSVAMDPIDPVAPEECIEQIHVLVVADDAAAFKAIECMLSRGFDEAVEVSWAHDWNKASAEICRDIHDVILVTHQLGPRLGTDLLLAFADLVSTKPFILIGDDELALDRLAGELGAADYLIADELTTSRLQRSIRFSRVMVGRQNALRQETTLLQSAHDLLATKAEEYQQIAEELRGTEEELRMALKTAEISEEKYRNLAERDTLTGLANRACFERELTSALAQAERSGKATALLLLDLDRFKSINDTHGHPAGDEVLRHCAERLLETVRMTDVVARLGGDEFAVIATNLEHADGAVRIAEKIIESFSAPIEVFDQVDRGLPSVIATATSIGISVTNGRRWDARQMFNQADAALYRAKDQGRGIWYCYDHRLDRELRANRRVENELAGALARDQLAIDYQPKIMRAPGGDIDWVGAEALLRWRHPERGTLAPANFISIAEQSGHIVPMTSWVALQACRQAQSWAQEFGRPMPVSINISPHFLVRDDAIDNVAEVLDASGLDPSLLELEITEAALPLHNNAIISQIYALGELGVRIAIDNFGAGLSSLAHARELGVDTLKIDQSCVATMFDNPASMAIIKAVIALAETLGLSLVAEGVETEQQAAFFAEGNIMQQGFLYGRPMQPYDFNPSLQAPLQASF